ncbi:MAG TPA: hypothetical protein VFD09_03905, partial [Thiopseudomonas sp.]|nr:hypothetical protein [Thiopseudomonas sp.]
TLAAAFKGSNHNISGNGYQKLPSGLIIQWGGGAASNAGAALSWPIAFPNGIFSAVAMHNGGDPWGAGVITATSQNKTRAIFHNSGSVTPISMRYIVIGY